MHNEATNSEQQAKDYGRLDRILTVAGEILAGAGIAGLLILGTARLTYNEEAAREVDIEKDDLNNGLAGAGLIGGLSYAVIQVRNARRELADSQQDDGQQG